MFHLKMTKSLAEIKLFSQFWCFYEKCGYAYAKCCRTKPVLLFIHLYFPFLTSIFEICNISLKKIIQDQFIFVLSYKREIIHRQQTLIPFVLYSKSGKKLSNNKWTYFNLYPYNNYFLLLYTPYCFINVQVLCLFLIM